MVCPSLPDCWRQMDLNYKYYFPKLSWELLLWEICQVDLGHGTRLRLRGTLGGGEEFLCSEMPLSLCRMKDNQLRECLVSPTAGKIHGERFCTSWGHDQLNTAVLATYCGGRTQAGTLEPALSCWWSRRTRVTDKHRGRGPWLSHGQMATENFFRAKAYHHPWSSFRWLSYHQGHSCS